MVRRIRECASCQQRFIATKAKDLDCTECCCSRRAPLYASSPQQQQQEKASAAAAAATNNKENATTANNNKNDQDATVRKKTPPDVPPVFDFYGVNDDDDDDDSDDDDDDDEPLVSLLRKQKKSSPPTAAEAETAGDPAAVDAQKEAAHRSAAPPPPPPQDCIIDLLGSDEEDEQDDHGSENEQDCIDLSEEEEEEDDDDEDDDQKAPIEEHGESSATAAAEAPQNNNFLQFLQEQQQLHTNASTTGGGGGGVAALPSPNNKQSNTNLSSICFVCGSSLTHMNSYKGRLNHIKRCSKQNGVTAKDVRLNDDYELFQQEEDAQQTATKTSSSSSSSTVNPYLRKNEWHGDDAATELAIVGTTTSSAPPPCLTDANQRLMMGAKANNKTADATAAAAPSVNQMLMAGARRAAKTKHIQQKAAGNSKKRRRYNNFQLYSSSSCPSYKKIAGTDFVCDGFQYASTSLTKNYFLTHFHADHYGGITKSWNAGIIYCSLSTATLVHQQLGVDRQYLHPLPMITPTILESSNGKAVTVTLLDANHCPGAVMFLFEVGKRVILHVGDFRWNTAIMSKLAPLRPFCRAPWSNTDGSNHRRIDDLYLDTTYCDAQYCLPTQEECIREAVRVAVDEVQRSQAAKTRLLMLFGAYTIGKEIVYTAVARRLGMKVYVDSRRYRILSALGWPPDKMSMLTTRPEDTIIWVVPLGHINMKKMKSYQAIRRGSFSRDFDRVVGFRPTGWSMSSSKKGGSRSSVLSTTSRGNLTVHSVSYSEHSSFPELVECLEVLNPKRIIPTVSVSKSQQQIDLLLSHWRDKQAELL